MKAKHRAVQFAASGIGLALRMAPAFRLPRGKSLTVFCYHEVSARPSQFANSFGLAISTRVFETQTDWIAANFSVIHPRQLVEAEALPNNAALITFDDGFEGSFVNGIASLVRRGLPSLMFLNMGCIESGRPMLSAAVSYLDATSEAFRGFALRHGLARPYHLSLTPALFSLFIAEHGPVDIRVVNEYQGKLISRDALQGWANERLLSFGNHLHEHWNSAALTMAEFESEARSNEIALGSLPNRLPLFAFPNGRAGSCYDDRHVRALSGYGIRHAFSANGNINGDPSSFLLDRITVGESDDSANRLWFRVNRTRLKR